MQTKGGHHISELSDHIPSAAELARSVRPYPAQSVSMVQSNTELLPANTWGLLLAIDDVAYQRIVKNSVLCPGPYIFNVLAEFGFDGCQGGVYLSHTTALTEEACRAAWQAVQDRLSWVSTCVTGAQIVQLQCIDLLREQP